MPYLNQCGPFGRRPPPPAAAQHAPREHRTRPPQHARHLSLSLPRPARSLPSAPCSLPAAPPKLPTVLSNAARGPPPSLLNAIHSRACPYDLTLAGARAFAPAAATLPGGSDMWHQDTQPQRAACRPIALAVLTLCVFAVAPSASAIAYDVLPVFDELSTEQQRIFKSVYDENARDTTCPSMSPEECWRTWSRPARATFFMITYVIEKTTFSGRSLIEYVTGLEGVISVPHRPHRHALTGKVAAVDGWRLHLMISNVSATALRAEGWWLDHYVHHTHTTFDYTRSLRDRRGRREPYLQWVLNPNETSTDADIDVTLLHKSSPKDTYRKFIERFAPDDPRLPRIYRIS